MSFNCAECIHAIVIKVEVTLTICRYIVLLERRYVERIFAGLNVSFLVRVSKASFAGSQTTIQSLERPFKHCRYDVQSVILCLLSVDQIVACI